MKPLVILCFRVHCFNNFRKTEANCPDLEVSYYIKCSEEIDFTDTEFTERVKRSALESSNSSIVCQKDTTVPITTTPPTTTVQATTTTPAGNAILVLSTYDSTNKPFIVDFNG